MPEFVFAMLRSWGSERMGGDKWSAGKRPGHNNLIPKGLTPYTTESLQSTRTWLSLNLLKPHAALEQGELLLDKLVKPHGTVTGLLSRNSI